MYSVLSERLRDTYDLFGSLPDTIEDDWIADTESLRDRIDAYIHERDKARNAFTVRYRSSLDPHANRWELCGGIVPKGHSGGIERALG